MIGDAIKFNQVKIKNRLAVALPVFILAGLFCMLDFDVLWNYVGISNQIIACVMLWTSAKYLSKSLKHLFLSVPAAFLTYVCVSYFIMAPHINGGLALNPTLAYIVGGVVSLAGFIQFNVFVERRRGIFPPLRTSR